MNDLEISNYGFLINNIRNKCAEYQHGSADIIFDNCHDFVNFFCDIGQVQTAITLYKQNKISIELCSRVIELFSITHKYTIENLS